MVFTGILPVHSKIVVGDNIFEQASKLILLVAKYVMNVFKKVLDNKQYNAMNSKNK